MVFPSSRNCPAPEKHPRSAVNPAVVSGLILAVLGVVFMIQSTGFTALGYELEKTRGWLEDLKLTSSQLQAKFSKTISRQALERFKEARELVTAQDISYIKAGDSMSLSQR
jgi:hypothetical protein